MLSADVRARGQYLQLSGNIYGLTADCQASGVDIMLKSISKTPPRAEPVNHTQIKLVGEKEKNLIRMKKKLLALEAGSAAAK